MTMVDSMLVSPPADLRLHINGQDAQDAVFPIRWCLSPRLFSFLRDNGIKAYLLLTILGKGKWEERNTRQLIPITDLMAYLTFYRAGDHTIFGAVIWEQNSDEKRLRQILLKQVGYCYDFSLFDDEGHFLSSDGLEKVEEQNGLCFYSVPADEDKKDYPASATLKVSVDKRFFAKDPPSWLRDWVNLWFNHDPVDQCSFRRRMILAFTLQPPAVGLVLIFSFLLRSFLLFFGTFLGLRGLNWKAIIPSSRYDSIGDVFDDPQKRRWREDRWRIFFLYDSEHEQRPIWFISLWPPIASAAIIAITLFGRKITNLPVSHLLNDAVRWTLIVIVAVNVLCFTVKILFVGAVVGFEWCHGILSSPERRKRRQQAKWAKEDRRRMLAEQKATLIEQRRKMLAASSFTPPALELALVCDHLPKVAALSALPANQRTIRLRFMDLKRKVCRPFQQ